MESIACKINVVDNMWIKQVRLRAFFPGWRWLIYFEMIYFELPFEVSTQRRIIPVSVATHICCGSSAARTAR
jgi:hypothetical protein